MSASTGGRTCPKCQAANFAGDTRCFNCGTNLEDENTLSLPGEPEAPPAPDPLDFPPGAQFADRYLIVEEIGSGSMGRVFKARDRKLDQTVALKMIRPEHAASPLVLGLFKKETSLARSLSQENIIRVFDLGESRGLTFISMEYVAGQSLEQLLRASAPLTEAAAVSITRQVCRALAAAHRRGIVHRDLKPQNILIDADGRVRVADFGLAQSFEVPSGSSPGRIVGTPAYMSPEQARGGEADARSDIYALGVIMYEMLTGRKPFLAESIAGYLDKHLHEKPKPPRAWNPGLSRHLERAVLGCLEKNPDERPPSAGRVLQSLEERRAPAAEGAAGRRRLFRYRLLAGAAALGLAGFGLFHFVLRKPGAPFALPGGRTSVAVMYFENNTGDPALEYLRKGLCYQVIQSLLQSAQLRVVTADRLFNILRDRDLLEKETYSTDDLKRVAERAQARYVLQGSFAKIGRVYKVNSLLLDTDTWESAGSTEGEIEDLNQLNAVVDRMTPEIKTALRTSGGPVPAGSSGSLDNISTRSPEALRHFIEGRTLYNEGKFAESVGAFRKAIEIDAAFAQAYAALGDACLYVGRQAEAREYLEKAMNLAASGRASMRDRYLFRGLYGMLFGPSVRDAVKSFQTVLSLYPDDEDGLIYLGSLYRNLEDWDRARECFERLLPLDRYNPLVYLNLSLIHMARGRYAEAADVLPADRAVLSEPFFDYSLSQVHLCQGRYDEALAEIEAALKLEPGRPEFLLLKGQVGQLKGKTAEARADFLRLVEDAEAGSQILGLKALAQLCLQEGRFEESRAFVDRGIDLSKKAARKDSEASFRLLEATVNEIRGDGAAAEAGAFEAQRLAGELGYVAGRAEALGRLGRIQAARGKTAEAGRTGDQLRKLIEESGRDHLRRYHDHLKGVIALGAGDFAQASKLFRTAAETLPFQCSPYDDHADYEESQARAAEGAGDTEKAIALCRSILSRTTGRLGFGHIYARSHFRLGRLFLKKRDRAEAADAFETFLRIWAGADSGLAEVTEARAGLAALRPPVPISSAKKDPAPR